MFLEHFKVTQELKKFLVFSAPNIRHYVHNSMTFKVSCLLQLQHTGLFFTDRFLVSRPTSQIGGPLSVGFPRLFINPSKSSGSVFTTYSLCPQGVFVCFVWSDKKKNSDSFPKQHDLFGLYSRDVFFVWRTNCFYVLCKAHVVFKGLNIIVENFLRFCACHKFGCEASER
jgi:hypothetical protein